MPAQAPWLERNNRRVMRSPVNILDKCTVVSIYPKPIHEIKYTIQPGIFDIPAGTYDKPALLVVGSSSWWMDKDIDQPLIEIPNSSIQIADSIIVDYANGLFACNMGDSMPGLFFIPGAKNVDQIKKEHVSELNTAQVRQKNWFLKLVEGADVLWARSGGNPRSISDDMRLAAEELGMKDKPWLKNFAMMEMVDCKFCGSRVKPGFPVCSVCNHVVDQVMYDKMNAVKVEKK